MIQFVWPWMAACLLLPILFRYLLPAATPQRDAALQVPFFTVLQELGEQHQYSQQTSTSSLKWLSIIGYILVVLAACRPQWLGEAVELPITGREMMLAVDLSGSMRETDLEVKGQAVNRLDVVKAVLSEFIARREGDRLGLILFADQAYLQTPLSFDLQTVQTMLNESFIGMAGKKTAIGDAIALSVKRLKDRPKQNRILILLTDGQNTAGVIKPEKAAELAQQAGIRIYSIGVGADEAIVSTFFGGRQRINPSRDLDEKMLRQIADNTGGRYFRARDSQALADIYQQLDELEPIATEVDTFRPITALYPWPLGVAFILASLLLLSRLYRQRPI